MMAQSLIVLFSVVTHVRLGHSEAASGDDLHSRRLNIFALQHGSASTFLLTSASGNAGNGESQSNFFASSLSNIVYPMISYAYYKKAAANYTFGENNQNILSLERSAAGMATVFTKLFQFVDADNNGVFTKGTDTIVDEYSLFRMPNWNVGEISVGSKHAKVSTEDGVFTLVNKANEDIRKTLRGLELDPMNTNVEVKISYPDLQDGNLVGLETYIVSTKASASAGENAEQGFYVPQEGNCPSLGFAWEREASLEVGSNGVKVNTLRATQASLDDLESEESYILGAIGATASLEASLEVRRMVYTFDVPRWAWYIHKTNGSTVNLSWEATIGINEEDDSLVSGAFSVTCWIVTPVSLVLPLAWMVNSVLALA